MMGARSMCPSTSLLTAQRIAAINGTNIPQNPSDRKRVMIGISIN
jgi:hypothetical protein